MISDALTSNNTPNFYTKWKVYLIILASIVGMILVAGSFYLNTRQFQEKIQLESKSAVVPTTRTPIALQVEKDQKALEIQTQAEPANTEILRKQARNHVLLAEYDEALNILAREESINHQDASLYYEMGNIYLIEGKITEAIESYNKSIEIDPSDNAAYIELANIYSVHQPSKENVIRTYQKAIATNPTNATFRLLFASFYEQINEKELALQQYQDILTIDPSNDIALKKVAQLTQ